MIGTSDRVWAAAEPEESQGSARESDESVPEGKKRNGSRAASDKDPPARQDGPKFDVPPFSFRVDLLNSLFSGRLRLELEVGLWKFISFEMVPAFVVRDSRFDVDAPHNLTQSANGLGPISGASFGLGFWPGGRPLKGFVLRLIFTNYGYTYETTEESILIDKVSFTERRLYEFSIGDGGKKRKKTCRGIRFLR
jgi:hypothetical protein